MDGAIVEDDDPSWQWRSWTINLFGFRVPILPWGVLIAAFFFLRFGPYGLGLFAIVAGGFAMSPWKIVQNENGLLSTYD